MTKTISVFGLGLMGRPMARTLTRAGFEVMGWNRSPLPADQTEGIALADLRRAAGAEVCLFMLADSAATAAVLSEVELFLARGRLVIDMGTSDPAHSRAHAARLASRGIGWVDAPVSGGPPGAEAGSLAIMAGATPEDFERARPVLQTLGGSVVLVGGPGQGHTTKLINQLIVGLTIQAVAEGLLLAERSGLDPRLVQEALARGFADSKVLQIHGGRMIERAYVPGAKVTTQLKDLRLALSLAAAAGLHLPHLASVTGFYEALVRQGQGDLDHSALHGLLLEG